jgi:hypothetical protein
MDDDDECGSGDQIDDDCQSAMSISKSGAFLPNLK